MDAIRSSGSIGSKPPILPKPQRVARTPSQDRPDTHTPISRDSARGTEQPLPTNEGGWAHRICKAYYYYFMPNFGRAVSHLRLFDRERLVRKHQLIFESSTSKNCQRRYRVECACHYRAGGVLSCPHELS